MMKSSLRVVEVLILTALLAVFLTACGSDGGDSDGGDGSGGNTSKTYILKIKGAINKTEDYFGDVRYLGEIENTGTGVATFVKITFTTYDSNDNVVSVDYTYINGNLYIGSYGSGYDTALGPNEYGSFEVITDVPYDSVARYETNITYSTYDVAQPKISLAISGSITEQTDYSGDREYLGEIINNGGGTAVFVRIDFTMKNSSDLVIGTDFSYINGNTCTTSSGITIDTCLAPSEKGSFEVNTVTSASDIASYYYRIYHDEYDVVEYSALKLAIMEPLLNNDFSNLTHDEKIVMRNEIIDDQLKQIEW